MNRWLAAAIGGLVATAPMSVVMVLWHRSHPRDRAEPLPPRKITGRALARVGVNLPGAGAHGAVTAVNHFLYGAVVGAAYPLLEWLPGGRVGRGAALGLGVWAGSYMGWVPAAGLMAPATRQRRERNAIMIVSHLVWGVCTAAVAESLGGGRRGRSAAARRAAQPRAREAARL
jgi:uncharacterized membrane protein YagU involved in acid resistance